MKQEVKLFGNGKTVIVTPTSGGLQFSVEFGNKGVNEVFHLTDDEAEMFSEIIKEGLGKESNIRPKERVQA